MGLGTVKGSIKLATRRSPTDALFEQYEALQEELYDHRNKHRRVFEAEADIKDRLGVVETQLKQLYHEQWRGKDSGQYTATKGRFLKAVIMAKWSRTVDVPGLLRAMPALRKVQGLVAEVISLEALDALVEEGKVTQAQLKQFVNRTPATPSVSFKSITEEE